MTVTLARRTCAALLWCLALAGPAAAQAPSGFSLPPNSPFLGGVPEGTRTAGTVELSLVDAIKRALDHNLGVLMSEIGVDRASGARRIALSELLPNVNAGIAEARQVRNLEAFGFPLHDLPVIVGPFNTFDARLFVSQSIFDLHALDETHAESHSVSAARLGRRSARDLVALDEALDRLARVDAEKAKLIELRFFGGLSMAEAAEVLGVNEHAARWNWRMAKAWLSRELAAAGFDGH